jgi:hypothetical protein
MKKSAPERYPSNQDSMGIEIVGLALPGGPEVPDERKTHEAVSDAQQASLKWLFAALRWQ